jgi:hypothetical protein
MLDPAQALCCRFCRNPSPIVQGDFAYGLLHPDEENEANHSRWIVYCDPDAVNGFYHVDCAFYGVEVDGKTREEAVARWNGIMIAPILS